MKTLRLGSVGADVYILQTALARSGYYKDNIDGVFGTLTLDALRKFQTQQGIAADGIAGKETWDRLIPFIRGYFIRTVREGDNYTRLAELGFTDVEAIKTANPGVNPDNLRLGQKLIVPYGFPVVPNDVKYTSELTSIIIDGLEMRYPFMSVESIGNSVMGREIEVMSIGSGDKHVFYNAAHHANEWITVPVVMTFLEKAAEALARGTSLGGVNMAELFSRVTLYVAVLVNPDGVDLVNGVITQGEFYDRARVISRDYPGIRFPDGWKANIAGTDLNLNYPAEWERARMIKFAQGYTSPAPRDFVGTAPLSAPESRSMYNFTKKHDFRLILAYHTQGNIIYWKFLDYEPTGSLEIGKKMSAASGYTLELTPDVSGYAGYKDWFIQDYNRPGYTIECGIGISPLPLSQFASIYSANEPIMLLGMTEV